MTTSTKQPVAKKLPRKATQAVARLKKVNMRAKKDAHEMVPAPIVVEKEVSSGETPTQKARILDEAGMSWYVNPKAFGVATSDRPCNFIPMTLLEEISGLLKRPITLEELQALVKKESDELFNCACGNCTKKVVPIKWLRIDRWAREAIDKLEGQSLLKIQHVFNFNGSFLVNATRTRFVAFSGAAYGFNKEVKNLHESVYVNTGSCLGVARKMNKWFWLDSLERVRLIISGQEAVLKAEEDRRERARQKERFVSVEAAFDKAGIIKKR